jgi:hypothetical protein
MWSKAQRIRRALEALRGNFFSRLPKEISDMLPFSDNRFADD